MRLKSNRTFSLLELLITVAILSGAVVFIFRSFTASLAGARFSQNITLACFFTEGKLYEIEQKQKQSTAPLVPESGREKIQGRDFNWNYQAIKLADLDLIALKFTISWKERLKEKPYSMDFFTYLLPKR